MRPLEDRLRHSKADLIAVRRINVLYLQFYYSRYLEHIE